jgi:tetratricopeptide (TPR) repeat protein
MRILWVLVTLLLAFGAVQAEQIRLADGRLVQGAVLEVKEDGFYFRLTETGGRVFLRWSQVDAGLKARLTNDRDPDEGLNLMVVLQGARLELVDGTAYEGRVTEAPGGYRVFNRELPASGRFVATEDVAEDGYIPDVEIDANVMMSEREVLALAEEQRSSTESARTLYELARIADNLGLFAEARDYVALALAAAPDARLESRLTAYDAGLEKLIQQQGLLVALGEARQLSRRKRFQQAIAVLEAAKNEFKPEGEVLEKYEQTAVQIDQDLTLFVIDEWYKQLRSVVRDKSRERGLSVSDAMNWARRDMTMEICRRIAEVVGSDDPSDMQARFAQRFTLETEGRVRLSVQRASFGLDGFYQIVGGHLPVAGRQPVAPAPANRDDGPRDDPRRRPPPRNNSVKPGQYSQEFENLDSAGAFQVRPAPSSEPQPRGRTDVSHLRVPPVVPSMNEWWERAGAPTRARWLTAFYARFGGVMVVYSDPNDYNVRYK